MIKSVHSCARHKPMVPQDTYCFGWDEHHHWSWVRLMEPYKSQEIWRVLCTKVWHRLIEMEQEEERIAAWKLYNVTTCCHCSTALKVWYVIISMWYCIFTVSLIYFMFKWNGKLKLKYVDNDLFL